jgi:hypothetical protein
MLIRMGTPEAAANPLTAKPGAWVDLGLTLPIFLLYHFGVIFLHVHNASDIVTFELFRLAEGNRGVYLLLTATIGVIFAGVFAWLGRGHAFRPGKFVQIAGEGVLYALLMRLTGSYVVGHLFAGNIKDEGRFTGIIMSLGAGFYEELAFRVLLFGLGAKLLVWFFGHQSVGMVETTKGRLSLRSFVIGFGWALVGAAIFSGVHYTGAMGDTFQLSSFVFRMVLGLTLTLIYVTRGFAAAVWAHALYDVWVLVL